MNINIEKTEKEIKNIEEKVRELNRRKRALRQKIINAENEEILETIRSLDLTQEELTEFLREFAEEKSEDTTPHQEDRSREMTSGGNKVPAKPSVNMDKVHSTGKEGHHEKQNR